MPRLVVEQMIVIPLEHGAISRLGGRCGVFEPLGAAGETVN